jgi:hypothetical protein
MLVYPSVRFSKVGINLVKTPWIRCDEQVGATVTFWDSSGSGLSLSI